MSYPSFKRDVVKASGYQCEAIFEDGYRCEAPPDTVHHFLKQSTFPQYKEDPDNGMASCGRCHTEIERRLREGEDAAAMYPKARYEFMLEKARVRRPERERKAEALERKARELRAGQTFLGGEFV